MSARQSREDDGSLSGVVREISRGINCTVCACCASTGLVLGLMLGMNWPLPLT